MIEFPLRTVGSNEQAREDWRVRSKRRKRERLVADTYLVVHRKDKPAVPCVVYLTRLAPSSGLDDDGLVGAMKTVRDCVAAWLGVDDRRRDLVRYVYAQARHPEYAVRVEFGPPTWETRQQMLPLPA